MSGEEEHTPEEYQLRHLYGFHEVKGLEGVWQRGRVGVDVALEPKVYSAREALEWIRQHRVVAPDPPARLRWGKPAPPGVRNQVAARVRSSGRRSYARGRVGKGGRSANGRLPRN
jgi:hypothetical protein